jgi:mannose-6-phosphate isomerase-like protein (cupin superfamily)
MAVTGSDDRHQADAAIDRFLRNCSLAISVATASSETRPEIREGAEVFAEALAASMPLVFEPGRLPALDTIDDVTDTELGREFRSVAESLPWTPTLRATDRGRDFALSPLDSVRDFGALTVGIMYVRPGAQYPLHHHPPQELYLTISGNADWRFGGADDFVPVGPNATLYNHPDDWHSAIAGDTPLVALYVLWP